MMKPIEFQVVQAVWPENVQCVVGRDSGRTIVYVMDGGLNFDTITPISDLRTAFLKTARFIDVVLDGDRICITDGHGRETHDRENRALINIDEIDTLQVFDEGTAWITLKNGGEINGVVLSERHLDNLVRRAGLNLDERVPNTPDNLGGYRLFSNPNVAPSPKRERRAEPPTITATFNRVCPKCSRESPCASVNCGLKDPGFF